MKNNEEDDDDIEIDELSKISNDKNLSIRQPYVSLNYIQNESANREVTKIIPSKLGQVL